MNNSLSVGDIFKSAWHKYKPVWWQIAIVFFAFVALSAGEKNMFRHSLFIGPIVSLFITTLSVYTMTRVSLLAVRGEEVIWESISKINWRTVVYTAILSILSALIYMVGFVLLIIPAFIALARFGLSTLVLVDQNNDPVEALKESLAMTKGHSLDIFIYIIVALISTMIVGILTMGIGLIFFVPFIMIATAHIYVVLKGHSTHHHSK